VPRVSSFELPISASHNHLLRVLPVVGCQSKTPTTAAKQSKLDTAFSKYHNDIQEMQAKRDDLVRKNKSLRNKNKGTPLVLLSTCWRSRGSLTRFSLLFVELETRVDQLKNSETDLKNLFYREQEARRYSS
jgi:hypothetical protein